MKNKTPDWLPKACHPKWVNVFDEKILNDIKGKLKMPTNPTPDKIFEPFVVDPARISLIIVGEKYPIIEPIGTKYEDFNPRLQHIWDVLEEENIFQESVDKYLQCDLSYWKDCLILPVSLTVNQEYLWKDFTVNLFEYLNDSGNYYIFCFLDEISFHYSKYIDMKKHEIFYKFQPKEIQERLIKQWGNQYYSYWGLPF